jgi:hypothetical protein
MPSSAMLKEIHKKAMTLEKFKAKLDARREE